MINQSTSCSDFPKYINVCKDATNTENGFNTFRNNSNYNEILEHVNFDQGVLYLNHILNTNKQIINNNIISIFNKIDKYGNPKQFNYKTIGLCSPTLLRYFSVLGDINRIYGNLDNKIIVEIGAGYGGQSMFINLLHNIKKYIIIDLPDVINLIKKFLIKNNMDMSKYEFFSYDNVPIIESDYLISNYAFSECNAFVQDVYLDKLINKTKNFYMVINIGLGTYTPDEIKDKIKGHVNIIREEPNTCFSNLLFFR